MFIGIDVAKDRLDVHVRPAGESFAVARDGEGIEELAMRLNTMTPSLIVLEATGGFETVVAAGLAAAGLIVAVVIRARSVTSPGPRLDWMPPSSLTSPRR
jgi:transposase